jgi:hypothetical protein
METSIDLSCSYWGKEEFQKDVERVRRFCVWLLANLRPDSEIPAAEIGYCLQFFQLLLDEEIIDKRKQ